MTTTATAPAITAPPTRPLLAAAALATPLWTLVSLAQALSRSGFDPTRHPLSALAGGPLGWIQGASFLVTGTLLAVGASGLRRALRGTPGGTWAPRLVLVAGLGTAAAAFFRMDPADGFPVGTPAGPPASVSWHGALHMAAGSVAFTALAAACLVLARHHARAGAHRAALGARAAAAAIVLGNAWAMAGGRAGSLTLAVGVTAAMAAVSATAAGLYRRTA
ncbi:DUF998 domain-containing protein [Kitasatospora sp. NBC_01539]|uniref:DUF998 domain-containing protein n=1 Tax=Kitasatospora sp. NBC_01539 TaxID=2903577 RepID=UPI0038600CD5